MVALPSVKLLSLSPSSLSPCLSSSFSPFKPLSLSSSLPAYTCVHARIRVYGYRYVYVCTGCIDRYWTLMCFLHKIHLRSHKLATETDASLPLASTLQAAPIHQALCATRETVKSKQPARIYDSSLEIVRAAERAPPDPVQPPRSRINSFFNRS